MRRLAIAQVAVLILCLAAGVLVYAEPASAAPAGGPDGWRTIHNAFSGKCIDDYAFSTANGNGLVQWDCNGYANQTWYTQSAPDGSYFVLYNQYSGKCMDDYGFSTANGNQIVQWDCNGLSNQRWTWYWSGAHIAVRNVFSGKCLDDYGFSTANGGPIVQWDCNGLDNQKWDFPYA